MTAVLDARLLHAALLDFAGDGGRTAFIHGAESIDYATLRSAALAGAAWLQRGGCQPGDRVAVALPKNLLAVRSIFAILAAGAVVVPIDPTAPPARIARILADARAHRFVTTRELAETVAKSAQHEIATTALDSEDDWRAATQGLAAPASLPRVGAAAPAVFYYTSGTTGEPKAIILTHANITSFVTWAIAHLGLLPQDRFASHAPLHFDLTTLDLYAAVRLGASTVLLDQVAVRFPARVAQIMEAARVSVSYSVPTALVLLLQHGALERRNLDRLRLVLFAGEPFPVAHLRRLMEMLPGREFVNLYGPTETNVCTYHRMPGPPGADTLAIPIGIACEHLRVELLREDGTAAAVGETAEIVVSGPAVMAGYWNNPALTESVRHGGDPASYRTGDFGRRDAKGMIHLAGRRDEQVKIRGHRVELPEIAATLTGHPAVQEAAALVLDGSPARLVACVALKPGGKAAAPELLQHCRQWLPAYALPEEIRIMPTLPRTSTGKVDKQRLKPALNATED